MSKNNGFESEYRKLEDILEWFDSDEFDLDLAQKKFDEAQKLVIKLKGKIDKAKLSVTKLQDKAQK